MKIRQTEMHEAGSSSPLTSVQEDQIIDLDHYVPAFFTWIAAKLSRGASYYYLRIFDVGIEIWRCMVLLASEKEVSAQRVTQVIGMDKASVSRSFKSMHARGLIEFSLDPNDGRLRIAKLTDEGWALYEKMRHVALERERVFLSSLSVQERAELLRLLRSLHEKLPEVEEATERYVKNTYPDVFEVS